MRLYRSEVRAGAMGAMGASNNASTSGGRSIDEEMVGFEEFSPQDIAKTMDLANQKAYIWITKRISRITCCNALEA